MYKNKVKVKLSLCLTKYHSVEIELHAFLTLVLRGGEWWASCPDYFIPGEGAPGTHLLQGWLDLRASLDMVARRKKSLPGIKPQSSSL